MEETAAQEEVQLPPIDFESFITDLITTAHLYLQGFRDPETDKIIVNLGLAKRMIDTLEMLEEKTKGNLTAPESNFLANSLYDLRMGYVRAVNSRPDTPEEETPNEDNSSTETDQTEQVTKEENTDS